MVKVWVNLWRVWEIELNKNKTDLQATVGMAMMASVFTVVQFYFQVTWGSEWRKLRVVLSQSRGFAWWVAWRGRGTKDWRFWRGNKSNNQSWDRTEQWQERSNRWREHEETWEAQWGTEQAWSVKDHLHFFLKNLLPTPAPMFSHVHNELCITSRLHVGHMTRPEDHCILFSNHSDWMRVNTWPKLGQ